VAEVIYFRNHRPYHVDETMEKTQQKTTHWKSLSNDTPQEPKGR